jgi:rod shape-determining protein MreC
MLASKPETPSSPANSRAFFPEGLMVGTIESYERRINESFYTVKVKLRADLKRVNHVFVIKNKFKTERDSLERETQKQIDD